MLRKTIAAIGIMVSIASITTINAEAAWRRNDIGWWYTEGNSWATGWKNIDGKWYYFDNNGYMKTGWLLDGGKWYYLNSSGDMRTGWIYLGDKWYYLQSNGAMATESLNINGLWYDFNSNGEWIDNTYVHLQDDFSDSSNINTEYALHNNNENSKQVKELSNHKSVNAANEDSDLSVNESNSTAISIAESEDKANSKIKKIYDKDELTKYLNTHIVKKHENHIEFYYCGSEPRLGDDSVVNMTAKLISALNLKDEKIYISSSSVKYGDTGYNIVKCDLEYKKIKDTDNDVTNNDKSSNINYNENSSKNIITENIISEEEFYNIVCDKMYELVNNHRKNNGIKKLKRDSGLDKSSYLKSKHMMDNHYFDHSFGGKSASQLTKELWGEEIYGENISTGSFGDYTKESAENLAEGLFNGWKMSQGHNENMLREGFDTFGFGFAVSKSHRVLATQQFGIKTESLSTNTRNDTSRNNTNYDQNNGENSNIVQIHGEEQLKESIYNHFNNHDDTWEIYYYGEKGDNAEEVNDIINNLLFKDKKLGETLSGFKIGYGDNKNYLTITLHYS